MTSFVLRRLNPRRQGGDERNSAPSGNRTPPASLLTWVFEATREIHFYSQVVQERAIMELRMADCYEEEHAE